MKLLPFIALYKAIMGKQSQAVEPVQVAAAPVKVVEFIEVATKDLTGAGLTWAVMTADGWTCSNPRKTEGGLHFDCENGHTRYGFTPSAGGEFRRLIHKHAVTIEPSDPWTKYGNQWTGMCVTVRDDQPHSYHRQFGPDPERAGLRAIVGAILGETVSIPAVLLE